MTIGKFLADIPLHDTEVNTKFKEEHITLDILMEMDTSELKADM